MVMRHTIILLALLCAACSSYSLKPYKMDIQQGNVVTSKMMLQLRPGMNKSQVRFIMGTPLIQDSFHRDRWDYFYQMRKDGKVIEQRRVILDFEGDALKRVRGDVIPAGTGEVAEPVPTASPKPRSSGKPEEKGLLDKLKFWKSDDEDAKKPQAAPGELVAPAAVPAEPAPAPAKTAPQPAAAPAKESVPAKAESAPGSPEPAKPAAVTKPASQPAPKAETQPSAKPASKPAPVEQDLPPEDEPGYFERMLEKIGF